MNEMTSKELLHFYCEELGWCGCGDPENAAAFLGKFLEAVSARHEEGHTFEEPLNLLGMEEKPGLAYGYLYSLDHYGLIEHGSSVRGCWLTEKGERVMRAIRKHDLEKVFDSHRDYNADD